MKSRILLVAGSILTIGALGITRQVWAQPDVHANPPAPAASKPPAKEPQPGHDAHESHESQPFDEQGSGDDTEDHGSSEAAHAKAEPPSRPEAKTEAKPAKGPATKPAAKPEPGARKPLFVDKPGAKDAKAANADEATTAERALEFLKEGNQRWASGDTKSPNTDAARRDQTAEKGQKPFATILTCADSRLPVERIFDRGVGEIFTVRVAGNVSGDAEVGTIEYGIEHLHTPLLIVMGHTKCGAVAAAASGEPFHGKLGQLVSSITPAVERVKHANPDAEPAVIAAAAIKENVWQSIFDLYRSSDQIREQARDGKVKVIGAIYDISTGKVEWLGEHPWQSQILDALSTRTATAEPVAEPAGAGR